MVCKKNIKNTRLENSDEDFDLELDKVIKEIKRTKAKNILIQLPDGLKPKAEEIQDFIEEKTNKRVKVFIWAGSCFGACDIPQVNEIDLLIQWGHSKWKL
ncbi:MAG: diphthamide synthesis protein [Candidatus Woesearchaeota archaeon]